MKRFAALIVVAASATLLSGCSADSSIFDCRSGADAPDKAVELFLTEAKKGNREAASKLLTPGGTVSDSSWDTLTERLQSEEIENLRLMVDSETTTGYGVTVLDSHNREFAGFPIAQVGSQKKCSTVTWGDYTHDEPEESQSADPNA